MKVLFYVEPLIELGRPYWKDGWLTYWSIPLANDFCGRGDEVRICASEALISRLSDGEKANIISFSHEEMTSCQRWDYLQLSRSWFEGGYSDEMMSHYKALMERKLNGFVPDLILTFTAVPFLKELFPSAVILHREYALFSRPPFPETWFLDPVGPCGGGAGKAAHLVFQDVRGIIFGEKERAQLERVRRAINEVFLKDNPYTRMFKRWREQYSHLILLPCQFSDYYLFDSHMRFQNQFEFVVYCMDRIPRDIGVVVTMHPEHGVLSADALKFLSYKYPNFIYSKTFESVYSATQLILPFVDAVVTVSSTVAIQCLIWKKKIVSLGGAFLKGLADASGLDGISYLLKEKYFPKDEALYWMLNNYAMPKRLALDAQGIVELYECIADGCREWNSENIQRMYSNYNLIGDLTRFIEDGQISYRKKNDDSIIRCELRDQSGSVKETLLFDLEEHGGELAIDSETYCDFESVSFYFSEIARVLSFGGDGFCEDDENLLNLLKLHDGNFFVDEIGTFHIKKIPGKTTVTMRVVVSGVSAYVVLTHDFEISRRFYLEETIHLKECQEELSQLRASRDELEKIKHSRGWRFLMFMTRFVNRCNRLF